jgi:2-polyprenyl-6-methoxyphenol hydroxylase-like FAD-dependent oxidoreductase
VTRGSRLNVLIVGAGVAGLTAAYWFKRSGHDVHVIERAAWPRDDGFMIDFYGPGFAAAEEMGLLSELAKIHREIPRLTFESASGSPLFSLSYRDVRRRLFGGRHFNFLRSDLERVLLARVFGDVDIHFGVSLAKLRPLGVRMMAILSDQTNVVCDLVVGAGGVHSRTRRLWMDATASCERYLQFDAAAFSIDDATVRASVGSELCTLTGRGKQVSIYPLARNRVAVFFVHEREATLRDRSPTSVAHELRSAYGGFGGAVPALLSRIETANDLYYDSVTQVSLPYWSMGRVVLVGDACQCVSPLGGQGASLAMAGARTLVQEIIANEHLSSGLSAYERRMRPVVARAQDAARRMTRWIAPHNRVRLFARDMALRSSAWPVSSTLMRYALGASTRVD